MRNKLLIGALSGAAVGFAGSLLLAPNSGKGTRGGILNSLRNWGKSIKNMVMPEQDVEEQPAKVNGQKMPIPGEVEHRSPKTINPTHTNESPVNQMTHKNKNNLSGRH